MCGIIGGFKSVKKSLNSLVHRGQDAQGHITIDNVSLGHTRLAILDLDSRSNQPFQYGDVTLVYNGELWNYISLRDTLKLLGHSFYTAGDTEVIAAALSQWGLDALEKFNGMFAIAWTTDGETLFLARDRFGEIPLHIAKQKPFYFASEIKALFEFSVHPKSIDSIPAGHYSIVTKKDIQILPYYDIPISLSLDSQDIAKQKIFNYLEQGTIERSISDVPICTLLSGGIDSAAITYFLKQHFKDITAYTAVYNPKSQDLKSARLVADMLEIQLIEIPVNVPTHDDLSEVIRIIEMPYKAQIEIGWACLQIAKVMQSDGFKVTYSGEGSDELWGSYGFAYHALKTQDYHKYRKSLFMSQQYKNFIRCNKIFMAYGIECRLPFLNTNLVEYAISLPQSTVQARGKPKAILQEAFYSYLPEKITKRAKVAFQDGMGLKQAISKSISNPKRFYHAEYKRQYST